MMFSLFEMYLFKLSYINKVNAVCPIIAFEAVNIGHLAVMQDLLTSLEEKAIIEPNGKYTTVDTISHKGGRLAVREIERPLF